MNDIGLKVPGNSSPYAQLVNIRDTDTPEILHRALVLTLFNKDIPGLRPFKGYGESIYNVFSRVTTGSLPELRSLLMNTANALQEILRGEGFEFDDLYFEVASQPPLLQIDLTVVMDNTATSTTIFNGA